MLVIILLAVLLAVVSSVAIGLVLRSRRAYERSVDLIPGQPGPAPTRWAGDHSPEARLHRRLGEALAILRVNPETSGGPLLDLRTNLEHEATALDAQLVAIEALPPRLHDDPLARVTEAVEVIEQTAAATVGASTADTTMRLRSALDGVRQRNELMSQAWSELAPPAPDAVAPTPDSERPPTAEGT